MTNNWNIIIQQDNFDGHRFWRHTSGAIAVTDNSMRGSNPANTHDGLLLVDTSKPLVRGHEYTSIPVLTADGKPFITLASYGDEVLCTKQLGMQIVDNRGKTYQTRSRA